MRKILCLVICLGLCLFAVSCAEKSDTAEELLGGIMDELGNLPRGKIYYTGAEEGSDSYLSADMIDSLYGEDGAHALGYIKNVAVYLSSFAEPCEISVFVCYSSSDALKIERMCRERADVLLAAMRESDICDPQLQSAVVRKGRRVVLAMTYNAPRATRVINGII